jgi:hypothetical protein
MELIWPPPGRVNKQYGTTILASDRIVEDVRGHFDFRLLDLVAVKGKTGAIKIYEIARREKHLGPLE